MKSILERILRALTSRRIDASAKPDAKKRTWNEKPAPDMEVYLLGGHLIARKREPPAGEA